jgi:hypothetical protein
MSEPTPPAPGQPNAGEEAASLARTASLDELQRLKAAEEILRLRTDRKRGSSRFALASQVIVGYVALAGFFVNAYQSYANKQQQEQQARSDQEKWNKEFARASQADKYRAFFETCMLATDPTNADKRLVGYALLQEFVRDPAYDQKAMIMLEESLSQELRGKPSDQLDDAHRAAVLAILTSLGGTDDCRALQRASRSVDRVARRHAAVKDRGETREVIEVYVRRLVGPAAMICGSLKDFNAVRRPIRDTMVKNPDLIGLNNPSDAEANLLIAEILRQRCQDELAYSGATNCAEILRSYAALCSKGGSEALDDRLACEVASEAATSLSPQPAAQPGAEQPAPRDR